MTTARIFTSPLRRATHTESEQGIRNLNTKSMRMRMLVRPCAATRPFLVLVDFVFRFRIRLFRFGIQRARHVACAVFANQGGGRREFVAALRRTDSTTCRLNGFGSSRTPSSERPLGFVSQLRESAMICVASPP